MKIERMGRFGAAVLVWSLAGGLSAGQGEDVRPSVPDRLVRMDLLGSRPAEANPPLRDIFKPRGPSLAAEFQGPEAVVRESPAGIIRPSEAPVPVQPALNLVYVGYIRSARAMIALVIADGQAAAVAEGEEVFPGVTVVKVTPDRIDLSGPGAETSSVPLQGEQP
ncbi:MAG: hypothetical protein ACYDH0_10325 [Candidatus Aminicenantales bacterium]